MHLTSLVKCNTHHDLNLIQLRWISSLWEYLYKNIYIINPYVCICIMISIDVATGWLVHIAIQHSSAWRDSWGYHNLEELRGCAWRCRAICNTESFPLDVPVRNSQGRSVLLGRADVTSICPDPATAATTIDTLHDGANK